MATHHNVIEINGKRYDASTGRPLAGAPAHDAKKAAPRSGRVIDGVIAHPKKTQTTSKPSTTSTHHAKPQHASSKPKKARTHQPKHVTHHKVQKSQSLMRKAVAKPKHDKPASVKAHSVNHSRLQRAKNTPKSSSIAKFAYTERPKPTIEVKPLSVQPHPEAPAASPAAPPVAHEAHHISPAQKHFENALKHAHAHEAKPTKKHKRGAKAAKKLGISRKVMNVSAAMLAVVLLAGFFAYQNLSAISMQVAASRAGIDARLPGYKPAGFALSGPIEYGPGFVSVDFASNADDRTIELTQKVSNWNSEALAENFLAANDKSYQTHNDRGRTIYVYDNTNATWVSGGIWYTIESNSVLNNDQLLRVASSLK